VLAQAVDITDGSHAGCSRVSLGATGGPKLEAGRSARQRGSSGVGRHSAYAWRRPTRESRAAVVRNLPDAEERFPLAEPLLQRRPLLRVLLRFELGVALHECACVLARREQQILVALGIEEAEVGQSVLACPEDVAHAAELEVRARHLEAVVGAGEDLQALDGVRPPVRDEDAVGVCGATTDPAAQLVEL